MGILYEYFAAGSDEAAVRVLDVTGGPIAANSKRNGNHRWDVIDGVAIEPTVNLADLEELLTGVEYDDIVENPRAGDTVASVHDQGLVITVTDSLLGALAALPIGRIAALAGDWSHAEEFGGEASPGDLTKFLTEFSALAKRAAAREERLYCWVSL